VQVKDDTSQKTRHKVGKKAATATQMVVASTATPLGLAAVVAPLVVAATAAKTTKGHDRGCRGKGGT
jgi:hypothetical protein